MLKRVQLREIKRRGRHERLRRHVRGTKERPRLCLHRSLNNLYAQMVDDSAGKVLFGLSTQNKEIRKKIPGGGNVSSAAVLGTAVAVLAQSRGVTKICFDRGGYMYHGRVKAFAEAARQAGLEF